MREDVAASHASSVTDRPPIAGAGIASCCESRASRAGCRPAGAPSAVPPVVKQAFLLLVPPVALNDAAAPPTTPLAAPPAAPPAVKTATSSAAPSLSEMSSSAGRQPDNRVWGKVRVEGHHEFGPASVIKERVAHGILRRQALRRCVSDELRGEVYCGRDYLWHLDIDCLRVPLRKVFLIVRQLRDARPGGLCRCATQPENAENLVDLGIAGEQRLSAK